MARKQKISREEIIESTFNVLIKNNSSNSSVYDFSDEAGINVITIYRKFESKNNLVKITIDHYLKIFIDKLEEIFSFNGNEEIGDYLNGIFTKIINLPEEDFNIIKVILGETDEIIEKDILISQITDALIDKLEEFFNLQQENGNIKSVDTHILSIFCFSILFQNMILWKIYKNTNQIDDSKKYGETILDILYNGIKQE